MREIVKFKSEIDNINRHSFEKAKKDLKEFSGQTPSQINLPTVNVYDEGLLWDSKHKVYGSELNNLTYSIQDKLIKFNNAQIKFIREFEEVYNALEALDKEYITAIITSIKNIEKTNDKIVEAQNEIEELQETQKITLLKLLEFKKKLEGFKHLYDVDLLWNQEKSLRDDMICGFDKQGNQIECLNAANESIKKNFYDIQVKFQNELNNSKNSIANIMSTIANIENRNDQIQKGQSNLKELFERQELTTVKLVEFKQKLEDVEHLYEMDILWNNVDELNNTNQQLINQSTALAKQNEELKAVNEYLSKKLSHITNIAYFACGTAVAALILGMVIKLNG